MNKLRARADDEDDYPSSGGQLGFTVKSQSANIFSVFIDEEVKDPSYYSKVFSMLIDAGEHDMVDFFIASPGGRIDGLSVLLEGIRITDAHTRAIIISDAHSAASVLALNCDEVIVTASANMLVHSCRYGIGGKSADVEAHVQHNKKTTEKLFRDTYEGFLSKEEIVLVLNGKELYLDSDDIQERLKNKIAYLAAQNEKEELPKPKTRKSKTKVAQEP